MLPSGSRRAVRQFDAELGDVAGRWLGREPPCVFLVQAGEVGGAGEQYSHLGDVVQAGAAGLENGLAIRQRLSCLALDRVSGEAAGTRVDPDDAETSTCGPALTP